MEKITFETKLAKLEELTKKLEDENLGLEESVKIFEEAQKLGAELKKELDESLAKMSFIVENGSITNLDNENGNIKDI